MNGATSTIDNSSRSAAFRMPGPLAMKMPSQPMVAACLRPAGDERRGRQDGDRAAVREHQGEVGAELRMRPGECVLSRPHLGDERPRVLWAPDGSQRVSELGGDPPAGVLR